MTHKLLEAQEGFIDPRVLEQVAGPGEFNFVTIAEWENTEVVERARAAVAAAHKAANFDPQEMFARLGIRADIASTSLARLKITRRLRRRPARVPGEGEDRSVRRA